MEGELVSTPQTTDESERKLWLDYIGKINDRHRRSIGSSGATSWVLFGAVVAVLFKTIPQLPSFLANRTNLYSTLVCFVFEFDAAFHFIAGYVHLLYFHLGGIAARAVPDRNRRLQAIVHIGTMVLQFCLSLIHFLAASSATIGPNSLRWVLAGIGVFWAGNFYLLVKKDICRLQLSRQHGIPIPWFEGSSIDARLGATLGFSICTLLAVLFSSGLIWYVSLLRRAGADWLTPLSASCYALVLIGVAVALAHRGFKVTLGDSYEALERSILLESLSSSEIRARFIAQFIGSGAADWLKGQIAFLREANSALREVHSEIRRALAELEGREDKASTEFKEAVGKALSMLGTGIIQHTEALSRHQFLIVEFSEALGGEPLSPPLTIVMSEWKAELQQMVTTARAGTELRVKLIGISRSL